MRPLSFCFFSLGLLEEIVFVSSCISLPQVFSLEWSLRRCCLNGSLFIFPVPHLHSHAAMQAGRGVEGNAIGSCCPGAPGSASSAKPLRRLENFPEALSSCLLQHQHLAKALPTNFFTLQILADLLCHCPFPLPWVP